jgi:hypothetical protein
LFGECFGVMALVWCYLQSKTCLFGVFSLEFCNWSMFQFGACVVKAKVVLYRSRWWQHLDLSFLSFEIQNKHLFILLVFVWLGVLLVNVAICVCVVN